MMKKPSGVTEVEERAVIDAAMGRRTAGLFD